MKKRFYFPFFIFLVIVLVFIFQLQRNATEEDPKSLESVLIGKVIPVFQLPSLENEQKMIDQIVFQSGSAKLLNVWATWCPTCYEEHYYLQNLAKQGVEIIGINYKDERDKALNFITKYTNPYQTIIFDSKGDLAFDLGVYGAPETFIIDGQGKIIYRHVGALNENVWQSKLKPIYEHIK